MPQVLDGDGTWKPFVSVRAQVALKLSGSQGSLASLDKRSQIVREILDLHTTVSMYPAISTEDLLNIPITLPEESICRQIIEKVRESRKAREQSKQLPKIAKTGVEQAIEQNEEKAIAWINQQLEALGVELT